MIDTSYLGLMYYVLYMCTFIFGRIMVNPEWRDDLILMRVAENFRSTLSKQEEFKDSHSLNCLNELLEPDSKIEDIEEVLEQFTHDLESLYIPKYIGNIVSYFISSLTFSPMYLLVVLRMAKTLWDLDKKKMVPFKPFYKKLAFYLENNAEVEDVFLFIFKDDIVNQKDTIFDIDLSDHGVNDNDPNPSSISYSIKTIGDILKDFGFQTADFERDTTFKAANGKIKHENSESPNH